MIPSASKLIKWNAVNKTEKFRKFHELGNLDSYFIALVFTFLLKYVSLFQLKCAKPEVKHCLNVCIADNYST